MSEDTTEDTEETTAWTVELPDGGTTVHEDTDVGGSNPGVDGDGPPKTADDDGTDSSDTVRREEVPDNGVVLQSGYVGDDDGVVGRLHEDDRAVGSEGGDR